MFLLREIELEEQGQVIGEFDLPVFVLRSDQVDGLALLARDRGEYGQVLVAEAAEQRGAGRIRT
jgi:hypothetical protein